jgi:hypothetical protein
MIFLVKPNQYAKHLYPCEITADAWLEMLKNPPVFTNKDRAPLAIYGTMASSPEGVDVGGMQRPRCTGANVDSIYALQLDFDSGTTIRQFAESYSRYRWTLYTSYSYGFKEGDRFRVVLPLAEPMPCELLESRRVKNNLLWNFPNVDRCCFDRGHWQILPCVRAKGAPYMYLQNDGEKWGGDDVWMQYARMKADEDVEFAIRAKEAREKAKDADVTQLLADLDYELREVPVGSGVRYAEAKRLLAKYMHRGLGDAVLSVESPWDDRKWVRQWPGLVRWASTIV